MRVGLVANRQLLVDRSPAVIHDDTPAGPIVGAALIGLAA
jgi:hypothetical protein